MIKLRERAEVPDSPGPIGLADGNAQEAIIRGGPGSTEAELGAGDDDAAPPAA